MARCHEHYSDFGDTTVFKLTSRYDFSKAAIRGTVSTGFRAPTLAEGYYSGINVGPASLSGIFAPNSAGAKALGISGLRPEKSTNLSVGFVLNPRPS
jgi:iron complex outermembrane receptor protein